MAVPEPFIFMIIGITVVVAAICRVPDVLPPLVVYGAVMGFQGLVYVSGGTFGFLRFAITVIPLAACLVAVLRPRRGFLYSRRAGPGAYLQGSLQPLSAARRRWTWTAAALLLVPAIAISPWAMTRPSFAPQEYSAAAQLAPSWLPAATRLQVEKQARTFQTERELAAYSDRMGLPDGSVVTDTLYGYGIVVASNRPQQFVIPSDFDFVNILNNPRDNRVRYLITVPNDRRGTTDAVNLRYPTIYETGADVAALELEFTNGGADQPDYRLYRVIRTADH